MPLESGLPMYFRVCGRTSEAPPAAVPADASHASGRLPGLDGLRGLAVEYFGPLR